MTLPRVAFRRALRHLGSPEAREFVVALLGARGFRTTVDGMVVTATDGPGEPVRLLVVADWRSIRVTGDTHPFDAVVVTGGPVASAVGSLAVRLARAEDTPDVHGPELLYEWFAFAVDSEASTSLADRYLGATEPTALDRGWAAVDGLRPGVAWLDRAPVTGRLVVLVLIVLLSVAAAATAGPLDAFGTAGPTTLTTGGGDSEGTPGITSVPVPLTPVPATTTAVGATVPDVCPSPPVDAHPASLRPGVIRTASTSGLEGWQLLVTQNLTESQFDPNDQQRRSVPELRHIAVYEASNGIQFRLGLDRWQSPEAAEAAIAHGGPWTLGFPWGRYGVWTEWQSQEGAHDSLARQLLAAVRRPDGGRLGGACVSTLLAGAGTNATA